MKRNIILCRYVYTVILLSHFILKYASIVISTRDLTTQSLQNLTKNQEESQQHLKHKDIAFPHFSQHNILHQNKLYFLSRLVLPIIHFPLFVRSFYNHVLYLAHGLKLTPVYSSKVYRKVPGYFKTNLVLLVRPCSVLPYCRNSKYTAYTVRNKQMLKVASFNQLNHMFNIRISSAAEFIRLEVNCVA